MKNIDDYIIRSSVMENKSDGNSPAFFFDDGLVLVQYGCKNEFGKARPNEEKVAEAVKEKKIKGVNTPLHLAVKRIENPVSNYCYVLQEKARGVSFSNYNPYNSKDRDTLAQLRLQKQLSEAPDYHYDKCIGDLCELFNMGLELKDKHIYYDKAEDGGFSFVGLFGYDTTPLDFNSLEQILRLKKYSSFIYNVPYMSSFFVDATDDEKEISNYLYLKIMMRVFNAMERVIPNFDQHRRWVLRTYTKEQLKFFHENGTLFEDLALTDEEYNKYNEFVSEITDRCLKKIASGNYELWQIRANEIKNDVESMGVADFWLYHDSNLQKREINETEYEFRQRCKKDLELNVLKMFYQKLEILARSPENTNQNIIRAQEEVDIQKANS